MFISLFHTSSMHRIILLVSALHSALFAFSFETASTESSSLIWPMPSSLDMGQTLIYMPSVGFTFETYDEKSGKEIQSATLTQAYDRYNKLIFSEHYSNSSAISPVLTSTLVVVVEDTSEAYPQLETDESYELKIPSIANAGIEIHATTIYGALRALETLSQVIVYDFDIAHYKVTNAPISVSDYPRFKHRGILIDTARHFEPIPALKRLVDGMSYAKFNVLHWHIVDSQAFPFQSVSRPSLWEGAFTTEQRYRQEEAADLVEYARLRGIKAR
jgi:hexosaminidase